MSTKVEQQLHGYRRGHERLAESVRLAARDAELVARLSDLSGSLAGNPSFPPYLTVYPLPSNTYYAVAMTWPDLAAPRSGCVLTHTLLVPMGDWRSASDPTAISRLFRTPVNRSSDEQYSHTLSWPDDTLTPSPPGPPPVKSQFDFVYRYFVEGKRPIVWFENPDPASTLWQILNGIWPALRTRFASCTFCLQPRTLEDHAFDLMFAPSESHARFLKTPPDQTIDPAQKTSLPSAADDWWRRWTHRLFGGSPSEHFDDELWTDLDDDPTAVRRLYLIESASLTPGDSPQTAVGAMDLVVSVALALGAAVGT